MRTLILVCFVALVVACGVAYAVGLVAVSTEHPDGQYVVSLIVNTAMIGRNPNGAPTNITADETSLSISGKITAVRPDKNEVVVSESLKNWTFQLARDGRVFINDRESKLADLQAGDDAAVTFDRQGSHLLASVIRTTRK